MAFSAPSIMVGVPPLCPDAPPPVPVGGRSRREAGGSFVPDVPLAPLMSVAGSHFFPI